MMVKKDTILVGGISNDINVPPHVKEVCIDCVLQTQLTESQARLEELEKALKALVAAKQHKDIHGKTEAYFFARNEAWRLAHAALNRGISDE